MCLTIEKKPKWIQKEEFYKKSSFDDALESLGVNEEFFKEKRTKKSSKKTEPKLTEEI